MAIELTKFEPSKYLKDDQMIADYLQGSYEDSIELNDFRIFQGALEEAIKAKGVSNIVKDTGLNRQSMYHSVKASTKPQFETISKMIDAMGLCIHIAKKDVLKQAHKN